MNIYLKSSKVQICTKNFFVFSWCLGDLVAGIFNYFLLINDLPKEYNTSCMKSVSLQVQHLHHFLA